MLKLTNSADLVKMVKGLAGLLNKNADHHKAKAALHEAMAKAHHARHDVVKAHADSLEDGDVHKAYFHNKAAFHKTKAAHHEAVAKVHTDAAEANKSFATNDLAVEEVTTSAPATTTNKATGADPAAPAAEPGDGVQKMIDSTVERITKKALETLDSDTTIASKIQEIVLTKVNDALGSKLVPSSVAGVIPSVPASAQPVPRPGESAASLVKNAASVDPEFAGLVAFDNN